MVEIGANDSSAREDRLARFVFHVNKNEGVAI